jgi:hypothetical protein
VEADDSDPSDVQPGQLLFTSGPSLRLPPSFITGQPARTLQITDLSTARVTPKGGETFASLFLASSGLQRLREAFNVLRQDVRVNALCGPLMFSHNYGCVTAIVAHDAAAELADTFNAQWASSIPISLASASASRDTPTWWLRPRLGKDGQPVDPRWRGQWPIQLLAELARYGIAPDGVRLSRQGKGAWLAGVGDTAAARHAADTLRLEGSFKTDPGTALYRLGPVDDPSALTPGVAEALLRAALGKACGQIAMSDASDDHDDRERSDEFSPSAFELSPPEVRTVDGADHYVWLGDGGALTDEGKPLLLGYQLAARFNARNLTVRIGAVVDPAPVATALGGSSSKPLVPSPVPTRRRRPSRFPTQRQQPRPGLWLSRRGARRTDPRSLDRRPIPEAQPQ